MNTILDKLRTELQETDSELEKEILEIIIDYTDDADDVEMLNCWADLLNDACRNGTILALLYDSDTTEFYQKHYFEIEKLIREYNRDTGGTVQDYWADGGDRILYFNAASWFVVDQLIHYYYHKLEIEI